MCGRYVLTADPKAIQQKFNLKSVPDELQARYNIAPTQAVPVLSNDDPDALTFYKWGLIPSWADDPAIGNRMINARGETVHEKPSFRAAFKRRRCLIPADGFYEWVKDGKHKTPNFIHLDEQALFAFAGLWEIWQDKDGGEIRSCTIITTDANDFIKPLHHRMPVILHEDDYATWLAPEDTVTERDLKPLLRPFEADRMRYYTVSREVNKPSNDSPMCIKPVDQPPQQQSLL